MQTKQLVTIKKAAELTGASNSFIRQLLSEGKLKRYKVNSATYVSLVEFEQLAEQGAEAIAAEHATKKAS